MHIPDGFISGGTAIATGAVSAGAVAYALRRGARDLGERQVPLVGVAAAFIFAVQMVNYPVGLGTSGHLIGGALAAILLGPWMATLVLAAVLAVQAFGMADGGVTALGANILLMGVIGGTGGSYLFRGLARVLPRTRTGFLAAAGLTAWASVVVASAVCALLIAPGGVFGTAQLGPVLGTMLTLHALIGLGEAAITIAVVAAVMAARPDLMATRHLLPATAGAEQEREVVPA